VANDRQGVAELKRRYTWGRTIIEKHGESFLSSPDKETHKK